MAIHQTSSFATKIEITFTFFVYSPQMHGRRKKPGFRVTFPLSWVMWMENDRKRKFFNQKFFSTFEKFCFYLWWYFFLQTLTWDSICGMHLLPASLLLTGLLILRNTEDRICSCACLALLVWCSSECYTEDWQRHPWSLELLWWVGLSAVEITPKDKTLLL